MRGDKVEKSAVMDEENLELYPEISENIYHEPDEVDIIKQNQKGVSETLSFHKKGLRLIELGSPPQIDGKLGLGTYFYLQRHVFMIFTDVILSLLLGNALWTLQSTALSIDISILSFLGVFCPIYFSIIKCFWHVDISNGHDNVLYYVINGARLSLFYGLCYTGPTVYNSNAGNLFAFSIFLSSIRFLILVFRCIIGLKLKALNSSRSNMILIIECIPSILYLVIVVLRSKFSDRLNLIYIIWAFGVVVDFISLILTDGISHWYRTDTHPEEIDEIISNRSFVEQLNSDSYDRMKVLTLSAFAWGGSQLFPTRKGVGAPDLFVAFDYSVLDYLIGLMGILIIFFLMRSYVATITNTYFCQDHASRKLNILIGLQKLLHVFIHSMLFLNMNLLKQCSNDIWDHLNRFPGPGFYFDFAQVAGYQFSLWRSLPYPTHDNFANFLRPWVANQTIIGTRPPGLYSIPSSLSGTSILNSTFTTPDVLFCSTLGILNLLLLFMHWTSQMIEQCQFNQCTTSLPKPIFITFNSILKAIISVVFFGLAGINVRYLNILWKMVIITALTFTQVLWDDSQRILGYRRALA